MSPHDRGFRHAADSPHLRNLLSAAHRAATEHLWILSHVTGWPGARIDAPSELAGSLIVAGQGLTGASSARETDSTDGWLLVLVELDADARVALIASLTRAARSPSSPTAEHARAALAVVARRTEIDAIELELLGTVAPPTSRLAAETLRRFSVGELAALTADLSPRLRGSAEDALESMHGMVRVTDPVGWDTGLATIHAFLDGATHWTGPGARLIKHEMRSRIATAS